MFCKIRQLLYTTTPSQVTTLDTVSILVTLCVLCNTKCQECATNDHQFPFLEIRGLFMVIRVENQYNKCSFMLKLLGKVAEEIMA